MMAVGYLFVVRDAEDQWYVSFGPKQRPNALDFYPDAVSPKIGSGLVLEGESLYGAIGLCVEAIDNHKAALDNHKAALAEEE